MAPRRSRLQRRFLVPRIMKAYLCFLVCSMVALFCRFSSSLAHRTSQRIAVVGGGASGIFAAIAAAEAVAPQQDIKIVVYESGPKTLTKVKVSGGGRCNVLHDTSRPVSELLQGYPRGRRELNGLLHSRFSPTQAQEWFQSRGVELKTEGDGRMFPTTDSSQTIIDTLLTAAETAGVSIETKEKVESIQKTDSGTFDIATARIEKPLAFDAVILATGSSVVGYELAERLGHTIVSTVPSLFTLSTKNDVQEGGLLHGLSGVSVPHAIVSYRLDVPSRKKSKFLTQEGPLLITHRGLTGPAALRLSAFGARELAAQNYRGQLIVNWAPNLGTVDEIVEDLWKSTSSNPKRSVSTVCPLMLPDGTATAIPKRLWVAMTASTGLQDSTWGSVGKKPVRKLAELVARCPLTMTAKGTFKEEFVTAGGVKLKEIDMKTMQSKVCPGLFLCGEVIDVDGVTGGYNFMNCW